MIAKLYRLEMKETGRIAKVIYPLMIFVTMAAALLSFLNISVVTGFSNTISILALIFCSTYLIAMTVRNDYHNFQGKRGYLFRAIPAKSTDFLLSRLAYYITYFLGTLIIFALLLMTLIEVSSDTPVFRLVGLFLTEAVFSSGWGIGFAVYVLLSGLITIIALIFVITVGSEAKLHRLGAGGPVLLYLIYYIAGQILTLVSMFLIPLGVRISFDPATDALINVELVTEGMLRFFLDSLGSGADPNYAIIGLGFIFTQILLAVVMVILTYHSFDKKFSLRA